MSGIRRYGTVKGRKGGGQEVACRVGETMRGKRQAPMLRGVNEERGRENAAGRMAVHKHTHKANLGGGAEGREGGAMMVTGSGIWHIHPVD